jgi:hypothetical protein
MFSVLALVAPLAVGAVLASPLATLSEAAATEALPNLCEATRGVCVHSAIGDAPLLRADVCWDGELVTLKGATECGGGRPYHLSFGYVADPLTNEILAYAPLPDTCDLGVCAVDQIGPNTILSDGVACCNPSTGVCEAPDGNGSCTAGDITWCTSLEANGDGTVTCHE